MPSDDNSRKSQTKLNKDIENLKNRISQANDNIKQTQKLLDIDLFLKQQKKKRTEYANNLNAQFEAQKKIR